MKKNVLEKKAGTFPGAEGVGTFIQEERNNLLIYLNC